MDTHTTSCPVCERMGRVTVTREDGTLTTATCANCNGYGVVATHDEDACGICNPATEERSSAYPREGEIEAAYMNDEKVGYRRYTVMGVSRWVKVWIIRYDTVTLEASYTTDGVWYSLVKSGDWTYDASGLGEVDAEAPVRTVGDMRAAERAAMAQRAAEAEAEAEAEADTIEEWQAYAQFSDYMDEAYEPVRIGAHTLSPSAALRETDWIAYREDFLNWVDFMGIQVRGY